MIDIKATLTWGWTVLYRKFKPDIPAPIKLLPEDFGGGKIRGIYSKEEIKEELCSRAGCGRQAHATWAGCADGNVMRPLCPECDVELNKMAMEWWGDPDWESKIVAYANEVQDEVGRDLSIPWMYK